MNKTAAVFSPIYYEHDTGKGHPESSQRLRVITEELRTGELSKREGWCFVSPEKANIESIATVHMPEYIKLIEAVCRCGGGLLDLQDTIVSPQSFNTALYAAGGTLKSVDIVMKRQFENAFALVRPPGHHAGRFRALGFCVFNNVAIAAEYLLRAFKLERVAILDVDAHHGNGTQEIFYRTSKVLYTSLHEDPHEFPGTGFINETGQRKGTGFNVNIPLPFRTTDQTYLRALDEVVVPIMRQYKPQFLLVSAGFDAHFADPVANLSLSDQGIKQIFVTAMRLASELCNRRLVCVLEGGYNLNTLGRLVASAIATMSGNGFKVKNKPLVADRKIKQQGNNAIKEAKKVQKAFWNIN